MHITWYGNTFIKLAIKSPVNGDSVLFIDPYQTKQWGLRQPKTEADIVLFTEKKERREIAPPLQSFIVDTPGEYETRQIFIYGIEGNQQNNGKKTPRPLTFFLIELERMTLGHLGHTSHTELTDAGRELLEGVDILFVPIGGHDALNGHQAALLIQQLEPRIVIPVYYRYSGAKTKLDTEKGFLKELGNPKADMVNKINIKKKDLPSEETKIILLRP